MISSPVRFGNHLFWWLLMACVVLRNRWLERKDPQRNSSESSLSPQTSSYWWCTIGRITEFTTQVAEGLSFPKGLFLSLDQGARKKSWEGPLFSERHLYFLQHKDTGDIYIYSVIVNSFGDFVLVTREMLWFLPKFTDYMIVYL